MPCRTTRKRRKCLPQKSTDLQGSFCDRAAEPGTSGPFWPMALVSDPHQRWITDHHSSAMQCIWLGLARDRNGSKRSHSTVSHSFTCCDTSLSTQSIRSSMTMVSCTSLASKASEFLRHKGLISVHASSTNHKAGSDLGTRESHIWVLFGISY